MRFKEFLREASTEHSFHETVKIIGAECRPFLEAADGQPLFRGIAVNTVRNGELIKLDTSKTRYTPHPQNRQPRDSGHEFNFMFNAMIDAAWGIENVRRNSFFATGDAQPAEQYGKVHFTFPVGRIKYIWSNKIDDSFNLEMSITRELVEQLDLTKTNISLFWDTLQYLSAHFGDAHIWINGLDADTDDVTWSILEGNGIKIPDGWTKDNVMEKIGEGFARVGQKLYELRDLHRALQTGNEIMFYETNGYYAIPVDLVEYEMKVWNENLDNEHEEKYGSEDVYQFLLDRIVS